jgi:hypothetical protein
MADVTDRFLTVLGKFAIEQSPVGKLALAIIREFVPEAHDRAVKSAAEILARRLDSMENRLDDHYIRTDQFVDLFKNYLIVINRTQHEEKYRAAANILVNSLLKKDDLERIPYEELDHFLHCVENLTVGALQVLAKAVEHAKTKRKRLDQDLVRLDFNWLCNDLTFSRDLLMGLLGELVACNLLFSTGAAGIRTEGDAYSGYGLETTPLGYRFVTYILTPGIAARNLQ